jgi:uncharacterized protein
MASIEDDASAPPEDQELEQRIRRLIQPEPLKQARPLFWSPGIGTDVWEMFLACMRGDLAAVKRLVAKDPALVRAHHEYRTPLSFAVRENRLAVAEFLLERGAASVGLGDPLEMARDRGHVEMERLLARKVAELHGASEKGEAVAAAIRARDVAKVRALLDASPELLHAGDRRSNQPIHWATMTRQLAVIDELLERGADIEARRFDGARPLHLTNGDYTYRGWRDVPDDVTTKPREVYAHLVARGACVDVWMAAYTGDLDRVRALLDAEPGLANLTNEYNSYYAGCGSALQNAAAGGHREIVELLLERGADPDLPEEGIAPNGRALYSAVYNGHHEIAELLLERGARTDAPVESSADPVWIAIRAGDRRMLMLLAAHGATWKIPIDLDGALTYADIVALGLRRSLKVLACFGDVATATPLFERDPSLANDPAALEGAASHGHEEFVRLLLRHQPGLPRRAAVARPRAMAELLFAHGMDPDRPSWMRRTPLHQFAAEGDVESAALYLAHGADIHSRDEEERSTPLAMAARNGKRRMVEFLLRRGAQTCLPDDPPWARPLAWARRRGHTAIARLLEDHERTGELPLRSRAGSEALAADLVEAYRSGETGALERIADFLEGRRALLWDRPPLDVRIARFRRHVRERLGRRDDLADTLALDDARALIARAEGCSSWSELVRTTE